MLRASTSGLRDQLGQFLKHEDQLRGKELGSLQDGIELPDATQARGHRPGDRDMNQLAGDLEPVSPETQAQHHQHHL